MFLVQEDWRDIRGQSGLLRGRHRDSRGGGSLGSPHAIRIVGDIRGVGAMRAVEVVKDRATREPAPDETKAILADCHQRGL
jgi:adenosylmethionine-8-amino-7-oxononanoate aminotransferase